MPPVDDSAWDTYNKILALAPNNKDAKSGITKIKDTYILWARHEIKKGTPEHATYLFKKALEISPGDPEILSAIITLEGDPPTNVESNSTTKQASKSSGAFSKSNLFRLLDTPKGIEKLLAIAELQVSRKNLTTPERNSAFTIYKIILKRFPRHTSALEGLKTIKETYIDWAKLEIAQGNYQLAESFYSNALKISPDDPEIVSSLDQLRKTINQ
jgi:tetratricopeptide (TPR) repeat protein